MKLALVVPGGVDRSGEYRVIPALLALVKRLALRHELHVYALAQELAPANWPLLGAQVHNIGQGLTRWRALRAIMAEHRRSRFDAIQAMWAGASGQVAVAAGSLLRVPSCVHVAGGELVALRDIGYGGCLHWYGRFALRRILRRATYVSAASRPMIDAIAALGVDAECLPLGVDLDSWPPRAPVQRDPTKPARLIHVASLNRVKDQSTLLRAVARLAAGGVTFSLDVVGEDTLDGAMQRLTQRLGLADRVHFHGFLTQQQLRPLMEAAHLLVMSSRHEAGPMVLLEAAVAGVPSVGTAVGHYLEWAPGAALAVPVGDAAALSAAIAHLLKCEEQRITVANAAQRLACTMDADRTAACLCANYARLAPGR
jgi:glycosyltransferase involved in cell wall biosynthesis